MADLPKAALWYARHGWAVFPLRPRTKEPFARIGVYAATCDTNQVIDWWRLNPTANIGLHCGGSNLLAIDLDTYKDRYAGDGILGREDEETITNLTGNGGTHLLYSLEDGKRYGNATGNLPTGIDIRGWGGYILLPPSIHPNGNRYQWEMGYGPHEIAPLPLPSRLTDALETARGVRRAVGTPNNLAVAMARDIVLAVLAATGIQTYDEQEYDGIGRKWILKHCPFNPENDPHSDDRAAYILIARDGHIAAGCQHARCRQILHDAQMGGWRYLLRQEAVHV